MEKQPKTPAGEAGAREALGPVGLLKIFVGNRLPKLTQPATSGQPAEPAHNTGRGDNEAPGNLP